ncbi:MAG: hypothetical protein RL215_2366 [Planctomycetota bacterium]
MGCCQTPITHPSAAVATCKPLESIRLQQTAGSERHVSHNSRAERLAAARNASDGSELP